MIDKLKIFPTPPPYLSANIINGPNKLCARYLLPEERDRTSDLHKAGAGLVYSDKLFSFYKVSHMSIIIDTTHTKPR